MKAEKIIDSMGSLPNEIIEEADGIRGTKNYFKKKRIHIYRLISAAACLALVCGAFAADYIKQNTVIREYPDLPSISVSHMENEAYGFEGYLAFDISELTNANPWNEQMDIETLPVYKNILELDENFQPLNNDKNAVLEMIYEVGDRLHIDKSQLNQIEEKDDLGEIVCKTQDLSIRANCAGQIRIEYEPEIELPDGYTFIYDASYDDLTEVAAYMEQEYKDVMKMDHPTINIYGGDYNIYGEQHYDLGFYDKSGDINNQIINYNFNSVKFAPGENKLWFIDISQPDLSNKVGDYPVITVKEAKNLLEQGHYVTDVPYQMPGMKYVEKVELVYRTDVYEEYFMPYFKFYVELPEEEDVNEPLTGTGMKTYGAYYVPAVDSRYISDMPAYEGSSN
ncbi:MAG: hypothetical protein ACI4DO_10335 [Roseburia sp.]